MSQHDARANNALTADQHFISQKHNPKTLLPKLSILIFVSLPAYADISILVSIPAYADISILVSIPAYKYVEFSPSCSAEKCHIKTSRFI